MGNKKVFKFDFYLILLCFGILFMYVGYASINSISMDVYGSLLAESQDGIFITEVSYKSDVDADVAYSKIISAEQTMLSSNIKLSDSNPNSSITYDISIYNSNDVDFAFEGVNYLLGEDTYNNEDIVFILSGLSKGDVLGSKQMITFSITFYYENGLLADSSSLGSLLNFKFEYVTSPVLASNMIPVVYENNSWVKSSSDSRNWHSYLNGKWANAITYNHNIVYNEVTNDSELKQFNGTSDYYVLGRKNYDFGTNLTIMARFKIYEYGDATQIAVGNIESAGFYLGLNSGNRIRFRHNDTSNADATTYQNLYSSQKIDLDTWYTVVVTYDGSFLKLYVNGVLEDSLEYSNGISISSAPLAIGGNSSADGTVNGSYFKGAISEVAIMTETLSESEIAQNYGYIPNHIPTKYNTLYYLKFDADNGVVSNSPKYYSDGMSFDGVDDFIVVGYSGYDFNNTFTIGARFKLSAYSDVEYDIFGNPQTAGINLFKTTDNKLQFAIYDENTSQYIYNYFSVIPELNTWYTIMATYDGSVLKLYLDGKEDLSVQLDIEMMETTTPFMIGVNPNLNSTLGGAYFNGVISDVILVDEALTSEQISAYYSSDLRPVVSDKTLISYNLRSYEFREDGTAIPNEMINAMWVWIPRFSAITPTVIGEIDVDINQLPEAAHDAFSFPNHTLAGFWIGKFENSAEVSYENTDLDIKTNSNLLIKPGMSSVRNKNIGYTFSNINQIISLSDIYGFEKDASDVLDTHLIKNNEWGALAYFTQSKYGLCSGGSCDDLLINDSDYITGGSDYSLNVEQSTTHNIYGVYDIYGGSDEFTMGNYSNTLNSLDGFSALPDTIYLNIYTTESDYLVNKSQHAMLETNGLFNNLEAHFVLNDAPWIVRNGLFSYNNSTGESSDSVGSRTVLIVK